MSTYNLKVYQVFILKKQIENYFQFIRNDSPMLTKIINW